MKILNILGIIFIIIGVILLGCYHHRRMKLFSWKKFILLIVAYAISWVILGVCIFFINFLE
jgi:hypothetical protein